MLKKTKFFLIFSFFISDYSIAKGNLLTITQVTLDDPFTESAKNTVRKAYQRIGIHIKFLKLPAERALVMSNKGITDGELFRVNNISLKYTNLIKVPFSYILAKHVAFSKTKDFNVNGWRSLSSYRIGLTLGYKMAEKNTKGFNVFFVDSPDHAFHMLDANRIDIVIAPQLIGLSILDNLDIKGIKVLTPAIQIDPLYHYLHKKHVDLVPKINTALQQQ